MDFVFDDSNQSFILVCLILAVFRIYLEVIRFDFASLPMTRAFKNVYGEQKAQNFHRYGLYMSIGYVILFAPTFFLS